jgi:hypothetical protein
VTVRACLLKLNIAYLPLPCLQQCQIPLIRFRLPGSLFHELIAPPWGRTPLPAASRTCGRGISDGGVDRLVRCAKGLPPANAIECIAQAGGKGDKARWTGEIATGKPADGNHLGWRKETIRTLDLDLVDQR